jgi:hypothetical protein
MTSKPRRLVFLDADVLASPLTRTLIVAVSLQVGSSFVFRWSARVEEEADRALRPGQTRLSELRRRFDWGTNVLVPESAPERIERLQDTSPEDRHVLGAAAAAGIRLLVTRNVRDFGRLDLVASGLSAVHPDVFMTAVTGPEAYEKALRMMSSTRTRPPRTPEELHAAIGAGHPRLFKAMASVYPTIEAASTDHVAPAELFRGRWCVACGKPLDSAVWMTIGIGPECQPKG